MKWKKKLNWKWIKWKWKWRQQTNELIINKSINSIHKLFFIWSSIWFNDKLMIQFNSIQFKVIDLINCFDNKQMNKHDNNHWKRISMLNIFNTKNYPKFMLINLNYVFIINKVIYYFKANFYYCTAGYQRVQRILNAKRRTKTLYGLDLWLQLYEWPFSAGYQRVLEHEIFEEHNS